MKLRAPVSSDIPAMVAIAETKRVEQEGFSPVFWRKAPDSSSRHENFLATLLGSPDVIALAAFEGDRLLGFAVAALTMPPPVYQPGGSVCVVDDFAVGDAGDWPTIGRALLDAVAREAKVRGAVLMVVVCPQRDAGKRQMLAESAYDVASEWHVRPL
ncbi:MAG: GNAT family N-acetyltransferase [Armatimonadaceae bacterium]